MITAPISDLKASLSGYLDRVRTGEEVLVTDRGIPVAKLVPLSAAADGALAMEELIRAGLVIPPERPLPDDFFDRPPAVKDPEGLVLKTLLDEREAGR